MNSSEQAPDASSAVFAPVPARPARWMWITAAVFLLAGAALYYFKKPAAEAKGHPVRAIPVTADTARTGDLHLYLTALGSVLPLNTVTIRSRVEGELKKIHFVEGQEVKAGELLGEIDPRAYAVALEQAQGQLERDTAVLTNAKLDLARYEQAEAAVTQQQLATARATVAQYAGAVKADQGVVDGYTLQLSYCRITSPLNGRVGLKLVDEGNLIHASDSTGLAVIIQERPITVAFSLPEDTLPALRKNLGASHAMPVQVYGRSGQEALASGTVSALDNQIDTTTGTVRLKAVFENDDNALFPNQFVNVRLLVEVQHDALLIPLSAVQISNQARYVFVVNKEDQTVSQRTIITGKSEDGLIAVSEGLSAGEVVVTDGLDKHQDGAKVMAREAKPGEKGPGGGKGPGEKRKKKPAVTKDS